MKNVLKRKNMYLKAFQDLLISISKNDNQPNFFRCPQKTVFVVWGGSHVRNY